MLKNHSSTTTTMMNSGLPPTASPSYLQIGLKRKADGRLIAPVVGPDSLTYLEEQPCFVGSAQPPEVVVEEELLARRLEHQIEDEKAKRARLEWCLREILAERDVLLRHQEDEARRKRQEELRSLGLRHVPSAARLSPSPTPQTAGAGLAPRPMPHTLHIAPRTRLSTSAPLPDLSQLPFLALHSSSMESNVVDVRSLRSVESEAVQLLGLPQEARATELALLPYQQPTKRLCLVPIQTAGPRSSADVTAHQIAKTSVGIGAFHPLSARHSCAHPHSGAGCESPVTDLLNPAHQCRAAGAVFEQGLSSSLASSPVSLEPAGWHDSIDPSSLASSSACSIASDDGQWASHSIEEIDYDDLLTSLTSGL